MAYVISGNKVRTFNIDETVDQIKKNLARQEFIMNTTLSNDNKKLDETPTKE